VRCAVIARCARFAVILLLSGAIGLSCSGAGGRDAAALTATTFGHMRAPAGSASVEEVFAPRYESHSAEFLTFRSCNDLYRIFATNDADAFLQVIWETAKRANWQVPNPLPRAGLNIMNEVRLRGDQTVVLLIFYDLDDPVLLGARAGNPDRAFRPQVIDRQAWRFAAILTIRDASDPGWSDCEREDIAR
jgi:hypothetical protein